jgi:hypothetical protein
MMCRVGLRHLLFISLLAAMPGWAQQSETFVSPYKEAGLPADALRPMLLDAALAQQVKNGQQLWIGDIMRIGFYSRVRGEFRDNLNFSATNPEKINRFSQQSQIFFFVNPARDAELKITLQDARLWGGDGGATTGDDRAAFFTNGDSSSGKRNSFDVREAYVQFRNLGIAGLGLQLGRQILSYGDGRMIGSANWTFGGLSYDGILIKYDTDLLSSHLFAIKGTSSATNNMPNGGVSNSSPEKGDSYMAGWYNTLKHKPAVLDIYAIGMFRNANVDSVCSVAGATCTPDIVVATTRLQRSNLYTFGIRLTNRTEANKLPAAAKWDYTLEAALQAGNAPDVLFTDVSGNTSANGRRYAGELFFAQTGYKVLDDLRVGVQAFYSPGTRNRTGSTIDTFQTLPGPRFGSFPYLNNFNGISENMGMKNIFTPSVSLLYESPQWGDFVVSYFYEMKATPQDAWYGISGLANSGSAAANSSGRISTESATNASGANLGSFLYHEVNLVRMQRVSTWLSIWVGAGYLHAGNAIGIARGNDFKADAFMAFIQIQGAL